MKTRKIFKIFIFFLFCLSCNRPDPTPEEKDPIYLDTLKEVSNLEKTIQEKQKAFNTLIEEMKTMGPRSMELKKANNQYYISKNELFKLDQKLMYLKLRVNTRMAQDRKEYRESLKNKTEWPNKTSYEYYKEKKKLTSASKTWAKQPYKPQIVNKDPELERKPASEE